MTPKLIQKQNGLSLLEAVCALFIISLISGAAGISIKQMHQGTVYDLELKKLHKVCQELSLKSMQERIRYYLFADNHEYRTLREDNSEYDRSYLLPDFINLKINALRSYITFYPEILVSPASIEISSRERNCKISTSLRGRCRISCKG